MDDLWFCMNNDCDVIVFQSDEYSIPRCPNCNTQSVTTAEGVQF